MKSLDAQTVANFLPRQAMVDALDVAFRKSVNVPPRAHHEIAAENNAPGTLLLMSAWSSDYIGVKIVTVFPENSALGVSAVSGSYLLMDASTGIPVALLDGTELTLQRTAAASALASSYLSRKDSKKLLMVGTGKLAPHLIAAHRTVRSITEVVIWGRRAAAADHLAAELGDDRISVSVADDLAEAVSAADIISCATLATEPLVHGDWLRAGQHLDLVGAFKPDMAEADGHAVSIADVYVDTRVGALTEAGEIVQALETGSIYEADIRGSLRELTTNAVSGRTDKNSITLFKSVGTALEDLAAAALAFDNFNKAQR
jgi:alanine dehydrogenase|tara:strand:+ start:995 stop:1942 length:948 start_codon:yes stop_codon:yes gene_type:complete